MENAATKKEKPKDDHLWNLRNTTENENPAIKIKLRSKKSW